jgi:parallel beta-helix repeat protein
VGGIHICTPASPRAVLWQLVEFVIVPIIALASIAGAWNGNAMAATVILSPGNDIQSSVKANPADTTFVLQPGVYRYASVNLTSANNGDSFIGQTGATLDGAKVLKGWTQAAIGGVLYWTTAGGTPLPTPSSCGAGKVGCCATGYPGCQYVQDLYVGGVEYQHVTSLTDVAAGKSWYYDFKGTGGGIKNNIYLAAADNPNSHTVELGDTTSAFQGTASNITIKNLTIKGYAAAILSGVITVQGPNWLIQDNTIGYSHGVGILDKLGGDYIQVLSNNVTYNGQMGVGGPANYGQWVSNTIAYNNADGVNPNYAGGGTKWVGSNDLIKYNTVYDNLGTGLFIDQGGTYDTLDHNTSYNNYGCGIRYEISRYGTITNNIVYGNSAPSLAEIVYTGSDHGRISGNTVVDSGYGGIVVVNTLGSRTGTVYKVTDVQVTNNKIWTSSSELDVVAGLIDHAEPPEPSIYTDPTNFFNHNTYEFSALARPAWHWGETTNPLQLLIWSDWLVDLQDLHGQVLIDVPPLTL